MEKKLIQVENLNYAYGSKQILHDVNFKAEANQIISLIGPNGSGKSTLLRCISGLLNPPIASVLLDGRPTVSYTLREIAKKIAFLPQFQGDITSLSVAQLVALGRAPHQLSGWFLSREDRQKIDWAIDYMAIESLKRRMVNQLSGGERQRVYIAMILAQDTPYILLDEPVTYMDLKHQWDLLETIVRLKEECNKTVVSVFHDINHAIEVSDFVYLMKDGRIEKYGQTDAVITEKSIHEVFGIPARICRFQNLDKPFVIPEGIRNCCRGSDKKHLGGKREKVI
jgi:iron complex transport system ATP-binding protein